MLRELQTQGLKPIKATYTASEDMKQGMAISIDHVNSNCDKATGIGEFLVDVPKNYDGEYSYKNPTDDAFEDITSGDLILVVPTLIGERYATDQLTVGSPAVTKGAYLKVVSGLFVKGVQGDSAGWVYGGSIATDPTGTLHIVERVATVTVP